MPERHSGEGIFFTSKVAGRFGLEANGHALVVDDGRDDVAADETPAGRPVGSRCPRTAQAIR